MLAFLCVVMVFVFVFVFFVKQKTAYEMRISDWSSDVCSSDLLRRQQFRQVQPCPFAAGAEADHAIGGSQARAASWQRSLVDRPGQIGRASCRERVCQYV